MYTGKMVKVIFLALCLPVAVGCAPSIARFDVLPFRVCEGTPSTVTWDVSGTPELTTNPAIEALPGEPLRYRAAEDTEFTLTINRWPHRPAVSQTEVRVQQSREPAQEPIAFTMICQGTSLVGSLPRPETEWDPRIRLDAVSSDGSREVTIEHNDRSVTLSGAAPSTRAFEGMPMAGTWKLMTPVGAAERCGDPVASPPSRIIVTADVLCAQ